MARPKSIEEGICLILEIFSRIEPLKSATHSSCRSITHTAAEHFCELEDTAETCGMSEVSYHLRKAKLAWMSAYGSRETKQTCMRLPVRVHCRDGVEADRPRGGRWFSELALICTACVVFVI